MRPHDDHRHFVPEPPLHRAARRGDRRELRRLVSRGADVNARADLTRCTCLRGLTPLMVAASSLDGASVETLKWLLGHGADLKAGSERGFSAAWYAAGPGYSRKPERVPPRVNLAERLRFLLDAGLDPDERATSGSSLLTEACSAGDPARVKVLLERGVDPAPSGLGPRRRRRSHGHRIPLFCAARSGSAGCVRLLLDAGADPNTRDNHGTTALFVAGSAAAARALLKAGAKLKLADRRGNDALQEALESDDSGGRKRSSSCLPLALPRKCFLHGTQIPGRDHQGLPQGRWLDRLRGHRARFARWDPPAGARVPRREHGGAPRRSSARLRRAPRPRPEGHGGEP